MGIEDGQSQYSAADVAEAMAEEDNKLAVLPKEGVTSVPTQPDQMPGAGTLAYAGAGTLDLTEKQRADLRKPFEMDDYDILPTGEIYVPQVQYRERLNEVLGPGQWAMVPQTPPRMQGQSIMQEWHLIIGGKFAASAWGSQDYKGNNDRMDEATAVESAKSNALVRCCKDLGIAAEAWKKKFIAKFKAELCVCKRVPQRDGSMKWQWRRKDGRKFKGEQDGE